MELLPEHIQQQALVTEVRFNARKLFKLRLKNQLYNLMMATISKLKILYVKDM